MIKQPTFEYEDNITIARIYQKNETFIGIAECAEADRDMMNKRTGETIALMRAEIEYYQFIRDYEILPGLRALNELFYSFNNGKNYNPDSHEARRIRKHIYQYETDLITIKELLELTRKELREYLELKEKLYHDLRANKMESDKKG